MTDALQFSYLIHAEDAVYQVNNNGKNQFVRISSLQRAYQWFSY